VGGGSVFSISNSVSVSVSVFVFVRLEGCLGLARSTPRTNKKKITRHSYRARHKPATVPSFEFRGNGN